MAFIAQALFDYDAVEETELSIKKGDRIIIQEQNESGWCLGIREDTEESGWLPTDFVEKIEDYEGEIEEEIVEQLEQVEIIEEPAPVEEPEIVAPEPEVELIPEPEPLAEPTPYTPAPATPSSLTPAASPPASEADADAKLCHKCNRPVTTAFVVAKGKTFHADCFSCGDCGTMLGGKQFIPRDNQFYCENCYYKNFNPACGKCKETIKGQYISALGQSWHPHCFVCTDCNKPFEGQQFHKHNNMPYCAKHYNEKFAEICDKCGETIMEQVFEALEKKFHLKCFTCTVGDHQIGEGVNFHVHENKVYCPQHFEELFLQRCSGCKKMINGQYVKVLDKFYHPQCWKCAQCSTVITSNNCGQHNGKFYCKQCVESVKIKPVGTSSVPQLSEETLATQDTPEQKSIFAPTEAGSPAAEAAAARGGGFSPPGTVFFSYDALKTSNPTFPAGVDKAKREQYLDDATFASMFEMDKAAFAKLPAWKQKRLKQKMDLF